MTVSACAQHTATIPPALVEWNCLTWVPEDIKDDVPGVPLPDGTQGGTLIALDGQTGRLDQSNDEKATGYVIIGKCETIRTDLMRSLQPRSAWQRLTPWAE